ncbi:MAG: hypothetical protein FWB72_02000 [Firmicutes bacterium]|nr:hypothetical protein [Bacillota bacterium]
MILIIKGILSLVGLVLNLLIQTIIKAVQTLHMQFIAVYLILCLFVVLIFRIDVHTTQLVVPFWVGLVLAFLMTLRHVLTSSYGGRSPNFRQSDRREYHYYEEERYKQFQKFLRARKREEALDRRHMRERAEYYLPQTPRQHFARQPQYAYPNAHRSARHQQNFAHQPQFAQHQSQMPNSNQPNLYYQPQNNYHNNNQNHNHNHNHNQQSGPRLFVEDLSNSNNAYAKNSDSAFTSHSNHNTHSHSTHSHSAPRILRNRKNPTIVMHQHQNHIEIYKELPSGKLILLRTEDI